MGRTLPPPQTCHAVSATEQVLSKVHKYNKLDFSAGVPAGFPFPGHADFVASHKPSLPFNVVTRGSKAPYVSLNAENTGLPLADKTIIRHLAPEDKLIDVPKAWCGFFCDAAHKILFRKVGPGTTDRERMWHVALYHYRGSAVKACPVKIHEVRLCYPTNNGEKDFGGRKASGGIPI